MADEGFLIHDIVPDGVTDNIPPFPNHSRVTKREVLKTKNIAKCRIHVERANARLKEFKILSFIPPYLRCYAEKVLKSCVALVNIQFSLIREIRDTVEFD